MARTAEARPAWDTGVGRLAVGWPWVVALNLVFIVMSVLLIYAAMAFWPPTLPAVGGTPPISTAELTTSPVFLGVTIPMTREQNLLLLVAILGGLGAMAHVLRSFFKYVGERKLLWSWVTQYFLIPFVGALLATITYILLRAGLIGGGGAQEGNIWGFAAVATLVGLFTAQAMSKLKEIFETIFTAPPTGSENIDSTDGGPSPIDFRPKEGRAGIEVALTGTGLENATAVVFGDDIPSDATWNATTGLLITKVPAGATDGPLKVTVTTDLVITVLTSRDLFTVLPG
jgi:hypothetical protein